MLPVGIVVNTFVIASLVVGNPRNVRAVASLAIDRMVPVAVLTLVGMLVAGGALAAAVVVREGMRTALPFDTRTNDLLSLSVLLVGVVIAAAAVLVSDLARVASVDGRLDTTQALVCAFDRLRQRPWQVVGAFGARMSAGMFLVVGGVTTCLCAESSLASLQIATVVIHGSLVALPLLRASWLARVDELGCIHHTTP
jgi:hypothetical protein